MTGSEVAEASRETAHTVAAVPGLGPGSPADLNIAAGRPIIATPVVGRLIEAALAASTGVGTVAGCGVEKGEAAMLPVPSAAAWL